MALRGAERPASPRFPGHRGCWMPSCCPRCSGVSGDDKRAGDGWTRLTLVHTENSTFSSRRGLSSSKPDWRRCGWFNGVPTPLVFLPEIRVNNKPHELEQEYVFDVGEPLVLSVSIRNISGECRLATETSRASWLILNVLGGTGRAQKGRIKGIEERTVCIFRPSSFMVAAAAA